MAAKLRKRDAVGNLRDLAELVGRTPGRKGADLNAAECASSLASFWLSPRAFVGEAFGRDPWNRTVFRVVQSTG